MAYGSHAFYLLELSPHGDMCGTSYESLLAKVAWAVLSSAPLQTHGVFQMFPRDYEKLQLPLFSLLSPETISQCL